MGGKFNSFRVLAVAVIVSTVTPQFIFAKTSESSTCPNILSLVGNTMCSTNGVPFVWASDYEVAVVYMTTMWSEFESPEEEQLSIQGNIAKTGFLSYCVRFKNLLAAWSMSLQTEPDVSATVKKTVSSWYQAVDSLSRNNWDLPETWSLKSFQKQFKTSFKHLIINGSDVYGKANGAILKSDVDDFTRKIANIMIEILKNISFEIRNVPGGYATTSEQTQWDDSDLLI